MSLTIREYTTNDTPAIVRLFTETVRTVNARDYSREQINAWAPADPDEAAWTARLQTGETFVAEAGADLIGFVQLQDDGYLDLLYVHHAHVRQGVGRSLLEKAVARAKSAGVRTMHTAASISARPFFEANGFMIEREQSVTVRGVSLTNYVMTRTL